MGFLYNCYYRYNLYFLIIASIVIQNSYKTVLLVAYLMLVIIELQRAKYHILNLTRHLGYI